MAYFQVYHFVDDVSENAPVCYSVQLLSFRWISEYDLSHLFAINFMFAFVPDFLAEDGDQRLDAPLIVFEQIVRNLICIDDVEPITLQDIADGALSTRDATCKPNHDHFDSKIKWHKRYEINQYDINMFAEKHKENALLEHEKCAQEVFVFQYTISLGE